MNYRMSEHSRLFESYHNFGYIATEFLPKDELFTDEKERYVFFEEGFSFILKQWIVSLTAKVQNEQSV